MLKNLLYDPLKIVFLIKDVKYSLHMVIGVHLYILELTISLGVSEVNDLMSSLYIYVVVPTSERPRVVTYYK